MSGDKSFFDTNVLLYMHSVADPGKQAIAQQVFEECAAGRRIIIGTSPGDLGLQAEEERRFAP